MGSGTLADRLPARLRDALRSCRNLRGLCMHPIATAETFFGARFRIQLKLPPAALPFGMMKSTCPSFPSRIESSLQTAPSGNAVSHTRTLPAMRLVESRTTLQTVESEVLLYRWPARQGRVGGSDKEFGPYTGRLQDTRGRGELAQAQTTVPPAEIAAETEQRNMTQEITLMPHHVSQNMFEKKPSRPIFGPSPAVTIFGPELSPQLAGPRVTLSP